MPLRIDAVMIGVQDISRAKRFYAEGLGCELRQDHPNFVSVGLGEDMPALASYERSAAAEDAGVPADGSGFTGVSFHHLVATPADVDQVMEQALAAGATAVRPAAAARWGGYYGYFADPDGYLWKVAAP